MSVPVAARKKGVIFGLSPVEILGSNPTWPWIYLCCECCVLSGTGLRDELITLPEDSY
jgi:hypothetical protein